jgi:hypothetical protein
MTENERQDDEMECGLGVAEHDILHRQLQALPDTMPPRAVWRRIEEQARAEGLLAGRQHLERYKWAAGAAIAAAVAMLALNVPMGNNPITDPADGATTVPQLVPQNGPRDLNALKVESQILERNLRLLPEQPTVMKVSTATTIQELQDRIAAIDYRLNDRTIKLDPKQEEIYWRERVRLMNSLVRLRYAQAQRIAF